PSLRLAGLHDHGDVARPLVDPIGGTLRTRPEPLQGRALIDPRAADDQRLRVEIEVVLRVRHRAREHLVNRLARRLGSELQHGLRLRSAQPANKVHHAAGLLGRDADEPRLSPGFHRLLLLLLKAVYRRLRRSSLTWLRKVRGGANSPSLWPIIASVMNTGTCLRPSCTAIVCPSMSGTIMERRDHVLMTFLVPFSFCTATFLARWSSTKGPFLRLRGILAAPTASSCYAGE